MAAYQVELTLANQDSKGLSNNAHLPRPHQVELLFARHELVTTGLEPTRLDVMALTFGFSAARFPGGSGK
jgi:hypothetical protein